MLTREFENTRDLFKGYSFEEHNGSGILLASKHIETPQIFIPKKEILIAHNMDEVKELANKKYFKEAL